MASKVVTAKVENKDKPEDKTISIPTNNESSSYTKPTKINKLIKTNGYLWKNGRKWKTETNQTEDSGRKSHRSGVVVFVGMMC